MVVCPYTTACHKRFSGISLYLKEGSPPLLTGIAVVGGDYHLSNSYLYMHYFNSQYSPSSEMKAKARCFIKGNSDIQFFHDETPIGTYIL
ncbi:hypothetical protein TNCT_227831 [Trichonephila clavata]|uniref:Uncharacterized protein n=1 Tax=Trichonephila clavata TaxID=2740835 RepID=A0A8X6KHT7_TRICU|nr:hypothetical protein TNCT_227831 [Trichonephila clavata]